MVITNWHFYTRGMCSLDLIGDLCGRRIFHGIFGPNHELASWLSYDRGPPMKPVRECDFGITLSVLQLRLWGPNASC